MDIRLIILERLDAACRLLKLDDVGEISWDDGQQLRACALRAKREDPTAWRDFITHVSSQPEVAHGFSRLFENLGWTEVSSHDQNVRLSFPPEFPPLDDETEQQLLDLLTLNHQTEEESSPAGKKPGDIMYIEEKPGLSGQARIGRVSFSASGKTVYYSGRKLQSLKGKGFKANYHDVDTGLQYWISSCKQGGNDTLYPAIVEIDEDVREEYWTTIRKLPQHVQLTKFRSEGKHAKRRPS